MKKLFKGLIYSCVCVSALFNTALFAATCLTSWQNLPFYDAFFALGTGVVTCYYADVNNPKAGVPYTYTNFYRVSGPWQAYAAGVLLCKAPGNPSVCIFNP